MPTRHHGPPAERAALDAFIKLTRAAESVYARASAVPARHGLTGSQFGVLEALMHLGPMCQRDLGRKILRSSGNMTLVIDNLEKRGLVRRERSAEDRRYYSVVLTAEGGRLIRGMFPAHARAVTETMGALTRAEQEELGRLCRRLGVAAEG